MAKRHESVGQGSLFGFTESGNDRYGNRPVVPEQPAISPENLEKVLGSNSTLKPSFRNPQKKNHLDAYVFWQGHLDLHGKYLSDGHLYDPEDGEHGLAEKSWLLERAGYPRLTVTKGVADFHCDVKPTRVGKAYLNTVNTVRRKVQRGEVQLPLD